MPETKNKLNFKYLCGDFIKNCKSVALSISGFSITTATATSKVFVLHILGVFKEGFSL